MKLICNETTWNWFFNQDNLIKLHNCGLYVRKIHGKTKTIWLAGNDEHEFLEELKKMAEQESS